MEKQIRDIIGQHVGGTYEAKQKAVEEILRLFDVSERSEQLCSCSSKILPNGNIQFSLCRKCQTEMKEHNYH